jgi:hypothetical protein
MTTRYPNAIDGYSEIRVARDTIDEIIASDHNDERSAIIAIEQALGIRPQGMYGTLVARLDTLESELGVSGSGFTDHVTGTDFRHPDSDIDSTAFTTDRNKFSLAGSTVFAQTRENAGFSDEQSHLLEKALQGFVIQGMAVTRVSDVTVNVAPGWIAVGGRTARYVGGIVDHAGAGTRYIHATINVNGAVVVAEASNLDVLFGSNGEAPSVALQQFTEAEAAWTNSFDLRRYGMFSNIKPYITVGSDGYGADFTSLNDAVQYVSLMDSANGINHSNKIVLVGDVTVTSTIDLPLGMEIHGGGHTIFWSFDGYVFQTNDSGVALNNTFFVFNAGAQASEACVCRVVGPGGSAISRIRFLDCHVTATADDLPYFLRFDPSASEILNVIVDNCSANVRIAGIHSDNELATIMESRITNNSFHQDTFVSSPSPCINVGWGCVVDSNVLLGGFDTGIVGAGPRAQNIVISNNVMSGSLNLDGYAGLMGTGISINPPTANDLSSRSVISDNVMRGVTDVGITVRDSSDAYSCGLVIISGNVIDNETDPEASMIGIICGDNTNVIGNSIIGAGDHAIQYALFAVGNQIADGYATMASAIECPLLSRGAVICDNLIADCPGIGIDVQRTRRSIVANNMLSAFGAPTATDGIKNVGSSNVVNGNIIQSYGPGSAIATGPSAGSVSVTSNRIVSHIGFGIVFDNSSSALVVGNGVSCGTGDGYAGISGFADSSVVESNFVAGFGKDGYSQIAVTDANSTENIIIQGNYIIASDSNVSNGNINLSQFGNSNTSFVVNNNVIVDCYEDGIAIGSATNCIVSNNLLIGDLLGAQSGISGVGSNNVISGNHIKFYGNSDGYGIATDLSSSIESCNICNNVISEPSSSMIAGIYINSSGEGGSSVVNNMLAPDSENSKRMPKVGIDLNNSSATVANNTITGRGDSTDGRSGIKDMASFSLIVSNSISTPNGSGISATFGVGGVNSTVIANNIMNSVLYGIEFDGYSIDNSIIGNRVYSATDGITLGDYSDGSQISNNRLKNIDAYGIVFANAVDSQINGNYILDAYSGGIYTANCDNVHIMGNCIISPELSGITITTFSGVLGSSIIGNLIKDSSGLGISVIGAEFILNGNMIDGHVLQGLRLATSTDFTAIGNMTRNPDSGNASAHGMDLTTTSGATIGDNRCEGGASALSFVIPAGFANTMSGNLGKAGTGNPHASWTNGHTFDGYNSWIA